MEVDGPPRIYRALREVRGGLEWSNTPRLSDSMANPEQGVAGHFDVKIE